MSTRVSPVLSARLHVLSRTSARLRDTLEGLPCRQLPTDAAGRAELLRYARKLLRELDSVARSSKELKRRLAVAK